MYIDEENGKECKYIVNEGGEGEKLIEERKPGEYKSKFREKKSDENKNEKWSSWWQCKV